MLRAMSEATQQAFDVDGVEVLLIRDELGAHWRCSQCDRECSHVLRAAVCATLASWSQAAKVH